MPTPTPDLELIPVQVMNFNDLVDMLPTTESTFSADLLPLQEPLIASNIIGITLVFLISILLILNFLRW